MRSARATGGRVGACSRVKTTTITKTSANSRSAPGTPSDSGTVANTTGTAPRSPAQDRKIRSLRETPKPSVEAHTDSGRATSTSTDPATSAGITWAGRSDGSATSPSITNSPICASHAMPSAKPRVAGRCGSRAFPSARAHR